VVIRNLFEVLLNFRKAVGGRLKSGSNCLSNIISYIVDPHSDIIDTHDVTNVTRF